MYVSSYQLLIQFQKVHGLWFREEIDLEWDENVCCIEVLEGGT